MLMTYSIITWVFVLWAGGVNAVVNSPYTALLEKKVAQWPAAAISMPELGGKAVQLRVFDTPGNRDYIGTELETEIAAPLATVQTVLERYDKYTELLPGFATIQKTEIDKDHYEVFWEKTIPVFFIKNLRYTVSYTVDRSQPDRRSYRGQLKEKKGLNALDSLLVIEKRGDGTHYYECAFFEGDFGLISSLAPGKIWRESVEAVLHGAIARKLKAERPDIGYDAIMTRVTTEVKTYPIEKLLEKKKPYQNNSG